MEEEQSGTMDGFNPIELMSWDIDEYTHYERGTTWYVLMIGAGLALLIYAVASANFLFALIILMFALIVYLSSVARPRTIRFAITDLGVFVGEAFYPYADISGFWFVYEPPQVKDLHLEFRNMFQPRRTIGLADQNPNMVREVLQEYVLEDLTQEEEPLSDIIGRILKL